jgi:Domain of unknown function (DUF4279)
MVAATSKLVIKCDLRIVSEILEPEEITARLGIEPTRARRAGELIRAGGPTVPMHLWVWAPAAGTPPNLEPQLDALWSVTDGREQVIQEFGEGTHVEVSLVIEHHGPELLLGWSLAARHVERVAQLGARLDVDEYDYTDAGDRAAH